MRKREKWYTSGLLPRMEARLWKNGKTVSYRYMHPDGRAIPLGNDKQKAILKVAKMGEELDAHGSLNNLWLMYQDSASWKKLSERSQSDYTKYSIPLLKVFGKTHIAALRPTHIARYLRVERASAPVRANRERSLLSNLCQLAIDHGLIDVNPCREVKRNPETPRDVLPDTDVLKTLLDWMANQTPQRRLVAYAAEYASLAGNRQAEFLDLKWEQIDFENAEIRLPRAKQRNGKVLYDAIEITPRMLNLMNRIKALNRKGSFVFPTIQGVSYTYDGFQSMWQRCRRQAIKECIIQKEDTFTFHDLRAYYATQHKDELGTLPELHASPTTTARVYDRSKQSRRSSL